jgi:hypothetical protein
MVDDGSVPPLPRRIPGASGSPRPAAEVELGLISEDLRQRVLTAIAIELERDEAERRRNAQGSVAGSESSDASLVTRYGVSPANGNSANPKNGSGAGLDNSTGDSHGSGASPVNGPPWGREALWPGAPVQQGDTSRGETADQGCGAAEEAAVVQAPEDAAEHGEGTDAGDAPGGPDNADPGPEVPLPRRAPGTNGAPEPPTELRREYLPPAVLGRRLDSEAHTQPLPKISGTGPGPGSGGPAATGTGQAAPSVFTPIRRVKAPPAAPTPAESPAEPGPPASVPSTTAAPAASAEPVPPAAPPAEEVPPGTVPPHAKPSASTLAAASAPTMPVGSAALAAAAAAGLAAPAETGETAADLAARSDLAAAPTAASASAPVTSPTPPTPTPPTPTPPTPTPPTPTPPTPTPLTSAQPHSPEASPLSPSGYGRAAGPGGTPPGKGRDAGPAAPLPAAPPTAKRPQRSGRPYRIAGVILAVVALLVAGVIALVLSGRTTHGHGAGSGLHVTGAGAAVREHAAAWVSFQVSRTAVVACDPVMCQALKSDGLLARRLYPLGPQTTSPLRSQIIVATAAVRARFGNLLGSVYAPAVLASFGAGTDRIDIRQTAQHGAAAYRAMLSAGMANRKASGAQLLHSGRITAAAIARRELAAGQVDGRLLLAIAQMSATHRMFIVEFGAPAPGADPNIPLRQADLAEGAHHHAGLAVSAGFVRSVVAFLHAQRGQFRPARLHLVHLADGAAVLRIEYTAPSPMGLPAPRA